MPVTPTQSHVLNKDIMIREGDFVEINAEHRPDYHKSRGTVRRINSVMHMASWHSALVETTYEVMIKEGPLTGQGVIVSDGMITLIKRAGTCQHSWVDTGGKKTWCSKCNKNGWLNNGYVTED